MNLRESLKEYSKYKESVTGIKSLNEGEVKAVRKAWKEGKFSETKKENMPSFSEMVKAYREHKEKKTGENTVTMKEIKSLRKEFLKNGDNNNVLSFKERNKEELKKRFLEKHGKNKPAEKLNEDEIKTKIMKHVREARLASYKAKIALKEGDMLGAEEAATAAVDSTNQAMNTMADATQGQVPQNVVDSVSAVKTAVDDLATQCGIQPTTDPNADPNANIPAVSDPNAADPNMEEQLLEGKKVDEIKTRLAEREKILKSIKEGKGGIDPTVANPLANIGGKNVEPSPRFVDKKDNETQIPVPTQASLVNGTEKSAIKWPTQKLNLKESESLAEQVVSKHLKESSEKMDFADILMSGVLG